MMFTSCQKKHQGGVLCNQVIGRVGLSGVSCCAVTDIFHNGYRLKFRIVATCIPTFIQRLSKCVWRQFTVII